MDKFEERGVTKNTWYDWYDWLINYVLILVKIQWVELDTKL